MIQRVLGHPRAARVIVILGVLLALPSLAVGFFSDDWFMLAALRRRWPLAPAWWDLYDFTPPTDAGVAAEIATGTLPWWTAPSLRLHLVRPLSSALLALDERIFGDAPLGWHLHSLVWWAVLLLVVAALYRRIVPGVTGTLALLIFTVVPADAMTYGWLSSRHMLVSAVPSLGALYLHIKAREEGWTLGLALAPIGLALGLLGGEAALGAIAYWIAYEAIGPPALGRLKQRALGAAPAIAILVAYFPLYRLVGGAVRASGAYVSPMDDPVTFARFAVMRLPMLLGHALLEVPVELSLGQPSWPFLVAGFAGVALCLFLWRGVRDRVTVDERSALRWLLTGALGAVLGTCGGMPGGRALLLANLGISLLLATLIRRAWDHEAWQARGLAVLLAVIHVGLAPLMGLTGDAVATRMGRASASVARALPAEVLPARNVFLVAASDPMVSLYVMATLLAEGTPGLDCVARITATPADHRVTRVDEVTLAVEPIGRPMLKGPFESLYRSPKLALSVSDVVSVCGARVEVAAADGPLPTKLLVRFGVSLDDPSLALVTWEGTKLARFRLLPGEPRVLPWHPGPMGNQ